MFIASIDPLSDSFFVPSGSGHRFLLQYMLAQQREAYGATILDTFKYDILIRNMKLLRKKYNDHAILRAIALATYVSDYPYSTKLIEDQLKWLQDLQQSPAWSMFDLNKS